MVSGDGTVIIEVIGDMVDVMVVIGDDSGNGGN